MKSRSNVGKRWRGWLSHGNRDPRVTSALVGTSKVSQVDDNVAALKNLKFSVEELSKINGVLSGK